MYLENILKDLLAEQKATRLAIVELTNFLKGEDIKQATSETVVEQIKESNEEKPKTKRRPRAKKAEVVEVTHDSLKASLMALSKADPDNRKKIKELLANYNAKKVTDLKSDDLILVNNAIEAGL